MNLVAEQLENILLIKFTGELTIDNTLQVKTQLMQCSFSKQILFDLGEITHIDTSGFGLLMFFINFSTNFDRVIKFLNPMGELKKLFLINNLFNALEIFDHKQTALDSFKKESIL